MDEHIVELLPEYALECLDDEERRQAEAHLRACKPCRDELASYLSVISELPLAAPEVAPPPYLKEEILMRARPPKKEQQRVELGFWERLQASFYRRAPAWGFASLFLIVFLAASNVLLWQRMQSIPNNGGSSLITVNLTRAGEMADHATGKLVMSADGEYGTLVVDGLPQLSPDQQYQLWLIRDGARASGGVFSVNDQGYASLYVVSDQPINSYAAYGVTIEPFGGSPAPTGAKVLGGSSNSG
jgi:anti-sigma-K factor RskA